MKIDKGRIFNHRDGMSELSEFQKSLSAEERAREIEDHLDKIQWTPYAHGVLVSALVAYGEEREQEAIVRFCEGEDSKAAHIEKEGYRRGIEEAAEICLNFAACNYGDKCSKSECNCPIELAQLIRK